MFSCKYLPGSETISPLAPVISILSMSLLAPYLLRIVFDVELIEVLDPAAARPANPHGAANPHSKPAVNVKPKPASKPAEK